MKYKLSPEQAGIIPHQVEIEPYNSHWQVRAGEIVNNLAQLDNQKELIEGLGYKWHGEFGIAGRRFSTYTSPAGKRLVHLHFFEKGFEAITRHLAFRDYLRVHPATAKEYEAEKKRAAQLHANDSLAYNDEKATWVQHHEKEALKWYHHNRK